MANDASLTHRLMFIDEWPALLCVTLEAGFVSTQESQTASLKRLLNVRWRAFCRDAFVRFMAIAAAHFAFEHWVVMRQ